MKGKEATVWEPHILTSHTLLSTNMEPPDGPFSRKPVFQDSVRFHVTFICFRICWLFCGVGFKGNLSLDIYLCRWLKQMEGECTGGYPFGFGFRFRLLIFHLLKTYFKFPLLVLKVIYQNWTHFFHFFQGS